MPGRFYIIYWWKVVPLWWWSTICRVWTNYEVSERLRSLASPLISLLAFTCKYHGHSTRQQWISLLIYCHENDSEDKWINHSKKWVIQNWNWHRSNQNLNFDLHLKFQISNHFCYSQTYLVCLSSRSIRHSNHNWPKKRIKQKPR